MSLTASEMTPADFAAVNNGGGSFLGGGDGLLALIILFLFFAMGRGNGWGGGNDSYYPVQQGFDQSAIMNGINGINSGLNGAQAMIMAQLNANQNASTSALSDLAMSMQNCCCENRAAVADLKYTIATENCADRAAISDGLRDVIANQSSNTQRILDQLCQDKIDAKNERIADLERQLTMANLAASQGAQTAQILADNNRQTAVLEDYLNPVARPAYIVQNPNCCTYNSGCACGA